MIVDIDAEIRKFQERMNKAFDELFKPIAKVLGDFREPLADIHESNGNLVITMELPGVSKEDISIEMTKDSLTVKAEKKTKTETKAKNAYKLERRYKGFYRSFSLPVPVVPEKAKATYKDGVLTITVPTQHKRQAKKIKVQ